MIDDELHERFTRWVSETAPTVTVPPLGRVQQRARRQMRARRMAAVAAVVVLCAGAGTAGLLASNDTGQQPPRPAPAVSPTGAPPSSAPPTQPADTSEDFGPNAVSFVSADYGWALSPGDCPGCGDLEVTTDAGQHWSSVSRSLAMPGDAQGLISGQVGLYFADEDNGYLFTRGRCRSDCMLATTDGGHSWQPEPLPALSQLVSSVETTAEGSSASLYALDLRGGRHHWGLYRSTPGSHDWFRLQLPALDIGPVLVAQGDTVALLERGTLGKDPGRLWVSADRGEHWTLRRIPCTSANQDAAALSLALGHPSAMLVDCFNGEQSQQAQFTEHHIFGSADGGRSWTRLGDAPPTGDPSFLADNGDGHAFLATESGGGNLLATSFDGGLHWHKGIQNAAGFFGWSKPHFVSASTGFIFGPTHYEPEQLYRTLDAGRTWKTLPLPRPH